MIVFDGHKYENAADVPVNEGDNIRISSDVFEGGDRLGLLMC